MQPIAQPIRRVPYHIRDKLSDKLDELVKHKFNIEMKSEIVTVSGKRKGRRMQTAEVIYVKARFKVIRCYCQHHSNSLPFTVVQKDGNSVVVEADGIQYRWNVTHVKKSLKRDDQ